ncbi:MAG: glycosyltransferase family 39 protein [Rhodospirillales bacterium]
MNWLLNRLATVVAAAVMTGLIGTFLGAAFIGIDFGTHYDEYYFVDAMLRAIENLDLQHGFYTYNGLYFVPGFVYLIADAWPQIEAFRAAIAAHPARPVDLMAVPEAGLLIEHLRATATSGSFLIHVRMIFAAVTALSILWVYLAARTLFPDSRAAPLLGAAFVAMSWEIVSHARFVAPDTLLMQFAALQLFLLARFSRATSPGASIGWALMSAVAGGLGFGIKLTGVFLILPPVFLLAFPVGGAAMFAWRARLALLVGVVAAFLAVFVVTTPGAIWDPLHFLGHIDYEKFNYTQIPPHHPHRIDGLLPKLALFAEWFALDLASPVAVVSMAMSGVAVAGLIVLARVSPALLLAMAAFLAIDLWFLAQHAGVYIRNCLIATPFIALAFAGGCRWIGELSLQRAAIWWLAVAGFAVAFSVNTYRIFDTAWSIPQSSRAMVLDEFRAWTESDAGRTVWLSPGLVNALGGDIAGLLSCGDAGIGFADPDDLAALFYAEREWWEWPANRPGFIDRVFSSHEINYDYVPSWEGHREKDRINVLRFDRLSVVGADASRFRPCQVRE